MRQSRRRVIITCGDTFEIPVFSGGVYNVHGTAKKGYIECKSSGTLYFEKKGVIDYYVKGSGLAGLSGTGNGYNATGGQGGGTSKGYSVFGYEVEAGTSISIVVADGTSSTTNPNRSAFNGVYSPTTTISNGGAGATISSDGGSRTDGKAGTNGTQIPFGETSGIFYRQYGAGGGGGSASYMRWTSLDNNGQGHGGTATGGYGGTLGGGGAYSSSINATAFTGSGGGGGHAHTNSGNIYLGGNIEPYGDGDAGGLGSSGIVIVRWGY